MEFFLFLSGDTKESLEFSTNRLGEKSFNVFWADDGLTILMSMLKKHPDKAKELTIINGVGQKYTIEEFVDFIEKLEVRMN